MLPVGGAHDLHNLRNLLYEDKIDSEDLDYLDYDDLRTYATVGYDLQII